jgi:AhpD family alkylhydroperoxidase
MSLLSRAEPIAGPWSHFAKALISEGRLDPCLRELVVLRVASRQRCPYVLAAHLQIAAHCGLSPARVAAATGGAPVEQQCSADLAVMRAADELVDRGGISAATKETLTEFLENEELIELVMLVGQYVLVGMLCRTFNLVPEPAGAR